MGQDHIYVYRGVVKQVGAIFELGFVFISSLMRAIRKDKSWALATWSKSEVDKLLTPLLHHMRSDCVERKRQKRALKMIN